MGVSRRKPGSCVLRANRRLGLRSNSCLRNGIGCAAALRTLAAAVVVAVVLAVGAELFQPARAAGPGEPPVFRRGINIGDYLAYPQSPEWPIFRGNRATVTDAELDRLAALGFDFIRLPVEPGPMIDRAPAEIAELEARLTTFVRRAQARGLGVLVAGFARHETPRWKAADIVARADSPELVRYTAFLRRLATLLGPFESGRIALELMNEPQPVCRRTDGPDWTEIQRKLHAAVRAEAPRLALVVTPGCWSKLEGLPHLDMSPFDTRTLVDVHYYEPFKFTHQAATWTLPELRYMAGVSFPARSTDKGRATDASARLFLARKGEGGALGLAPTLKFIDAYVRENADEASVARDIAAIGRWADRQKVDRRRVIVGEFGALRLPPEAGVPDDGSRARWLAAVRRAAETERLGWALWSYHSIFGLLEDEAAGRLDAGMVEALGLDVSRR